MEQRCSNTPNCDFCGILSVSCPCYCWLTLGTPASSNCPKTCMHWWSDYSKLPIVKKCGNEWMSVCIVTHANNNPLSRIGVTSSTAVMSVNEEPDFFVMIRKTFDSVKLFHVFYKLGQGSCWGKNKPTQFKPLTWKSLKLRNYLNEFIVYIHS